MFLGFPILRILEQTSSFFGFSDTRIDFQYFRFQRYQNRFLSFIISEIPEQISIIPDFGDARRDFYHFQFCEYQDRFLLFPIWGYQDIFLSCPISAVVDQPPPPHIDSSVSQKSRHASITKSPGHHMSSLASHHKVLSEMKYQFSTDL